MTQAQFAKMLTALNPESLAALAAFVNGSKPAKQAQPKRSKAEWLAAKDRSIVATFKKRGVTDVILMDRDNRSKPFNIRPFGRKNEAGELTGWLAEGKIVKKGESGVKGLFHVSQTRDMTDEEVEKFAS
jgi:hypothetical protein